MWRYNNYYTSVMDNPLPAYKVDEPYIFVNDSYNNAFAVFLESVWLNGFDCSIWYNEGIKVLRVAPKFSMNIDQLIKRVTLDLLNGMVRDYFGDDGPTITSVKSKPATFPYLENGASNNALLLELSVTSDSRDVIPNELVLKAGNNIEGTAERELLFFKLLADEAPVPQVVRCFGTKWLADEDIGLLLLENSAGNAIVYDGPTEPDLPKYHSAIRSLAELHARWWNHSEIGSGNLRHHWTQEFLSQATTLVKDGSRELTENSPDSWSLSDSARASLIATSLSM